VQLAEISFVLEARRARRNGKFKVRALEKHEGYGPRLTFLFRLTNSSNVLAGQGKKTQDPPSQTEGGAPSVWS
jgi:hypothetical protein